MWKTKLKHRIKNFKPFVQNGMARFKISFENILLSLFMVFLSFFLINNIYLSVQNGLRGYNTLKEEKKVLDQLELENKKLQADEEYHQSNFYTELYARESLNYAKQGQELYKIERSETYDYDKLTQNDPITIDNYREWWFRLIL